MDYITADVFGCTDSFDSSFFNWLKGPRMNEWTCIIQMISSNLFCSMVFTDLHHLVHSFQKVWVYWINYLSTRLHIKLSWGNKTLIGSPLVPGKVWAQSGSLLCHLFFAKTTSTNGCLLIVMLKERTHHHLMHISRSLNRNVSMISIMIICEGEFFNASTILHWTHVSTNSVPYFDLFCKSCDSS